MNTTAEARVIASFTFIVALVLGAWGALDAMIASSSLLPFAPHLGRLIVGLMPFVATAVAFQASQSTEEVWARTLGGAGVMLGVLTCLAAVPYIVAVR